MKQGQRYVLLLLLLLGGSIYWNQGPVDTFLSLGQRDTKQETDPEQADDTDEAHPEETAEAEETGQDPRLSALTGDETWKAALELRGFLKKNPATPKRKRFIGALAEVADAKKKEADELVEIGATWEARNALSDAYFATMDKTVRQRLARRLDEMNRELIFSPRPSKDAEMVTVQSGDSLSKIGADYNVPYRFIMQVNGMKSTMLRVGDRLKVVRGTREIWISKSDFELVVTLDGHYFASFPIGTGKDGRTPERSFTIVEKTMEPTWYSRGGVYPFGHPENPLGTRWLGFNDSEDLMGFGIHGTKAPESIGTESSNGCIRLQNEHVEQLFDLVPRGTKVTIQP